MGCPRRARLLRELGLGFGFGLGLGLGLGVGVGARACSASSGERYALSACTFLAFCAAFRSWLGVRGGGEGWKVGLGLGFGLE